MFTLTSSEDRRAALSLDSTILDSKVAHRFFFAIFFVRRAGARMCHWAGTARRVSIGGHARRFIRFVGFLAESSRLYCRAYYDAIQYYDTVDYTTACRVIFNIKPCNICNILYSFSISRRLESRLILMYKL